MNIKNERLLNRWIALLLFKKGEEIDDCIGEKINRRNARKT